MTEEDNKNDFYSKHRVFIIIAICVLLFFAFIYLTGGEGFNMIGSALLSFSLMSFGNTAGPAYNLKNAFGIVK